MPDGVQGRGKEEIAEDVAEVEGIRSNTVELLRNRPIQPISGRVKKPKRGRPDMQRNRNECFRQKEERAKNCSQNPGFFFAEMTRGHLSSSSY